MADITAKYVRFVAPAPCVTNFMASNGSQRKMTALPVDIIKRLIDQGAKVAEVKEILDEDDNVVGYEDVVLTEENFDKDNECIAIPEDVTVTVDIDKEVADKHAAEWEAHMTEIGQEIKKEQDKKKESSTVVVEGGGEGATGGPEPGTGPVITPPAGPTMEEEGGSL